VCPQDCEGFRNVPFHQPFSDFLASAPRGECRLPTGIPSFTEDELASSFLQRYKLLYRKSLLAPERFNAFPLILRSSSFHFPFGEACHWLPRRRLERDSCRASLRRCQEVFRENLAPVPPLPQLENSQDPFRKRRAC